MAATQTAPTTEPSSAPSPRSRLSEVSWPELASTLGLIVMAILFAVLNPGYLSEGNVSAILQASAILIVLTIGQTFVIATGGIDLAVGDDQSQPGRRRQGAKGDDEVGDAALGDDEHVEDTDEHGGRESSSSGGPDVPAGGVELA